MDISAEDAARRLRAGDLSFIVRSDPKRLGELRSLGPAALFQTALKAETLLTEAERARVSGAGDHVEGVSIPDDALVAALFNAAWTYSEGLERREAGKRFLKRLPTGFPPAVEIARRLITDYPEDPEAMTLAAEAFATAGAFEELLAVPDAAVQTDDRIRALTFAAAVVAAKDSGDEQQLRRAELEAARYFLEEPLRPAFTAAYAQFAKAVGPTWKPSIAIDGFPEPEDFAALIRGRSAVVDRAYGLAISEFKKIALQDRTVFLKRPELLADLGKGFQYGGAAAEGATLFEAWATLAAAAEEAPIRYRLLFYAGRMRRQRGELEKATVLFARALPLAPDAEQRDAVLWYLLDGAISVSAPRAVSLLASYAPSFNSPRYFYDVFDRLCGALVEAKAWHELLEAFGVIQRIADGSVTARYAYILGRARSLGYLDVDRASYSLGTSEGTDRDALARTFFEMAFNADSAPLYYRILAASFLGSAYNLLPIEKRGVAERIDEDKKEVSRFLVAFFDFGNAGLAYPFVSSRIEELPGDIIRETARRFAEAGRYGDSIRTIGALGRRKGYHPNRSDMELLYPRAFQSELLDAARRWDIPEDQLFGLVRSESLFIADVVSHAGAVGLAQLMMPTARDVAARIGKSVRLSIRDGLPNLSDPATNVELGAWYLADLRKRLQSPLLALFAYNGGITRVRRWRAAESSLPEDLFLETVPLAETREYGRKVLAATAVYGYLYAGKTLEQAVADILPGLE